MNLSFTQNLYRVVTGQLGVSVATASFLPYLFGGLKIFEGILRGRAAKDAGKRAQWAYDANAADLRKFAGLNAGFIMGAAERNAQAYMTIGEANASAIERALARNLMLYGMQADEEVRRHIRGERMVAGSIRAMTGAAGVQTNTGTPLHFLHDQVDEGIRQRTFMQAKHYQTMWTMAEEGKDKAFITRLTASENAAVIMSNAEAQAGIAMLDAERQAMAMERSGEVAAASGAASAQASLIGGLLGGIQSFAAMGGSFGLPSAPTLATNWKGSGLGWSSSQTLNTGFMNPFPQYGSSLSTGFTSWGST